MKDQNVELKTLIVRLKKAAYTDRGVKEFYPAPNLMN